MAAWAASSETATTVSAIGLGLGHLRKLGTHYFVTSPSGTGLSPVWDYRSGVGPDSDAGFVLAAKVADVPAPTGSQDIDWLQLRNVSGGLATEVCISRFLRLQRLTSYPSSQIYRTDTRLGQAPASCTPDSPPISVKYVSKYCKMMAFLRGPFPVAHPAFS